jgi:predicted nucleic acid-binding protein
VLLDTGPLGLATNPKRSPQNVACAQWLQSLINGNARVVVPEIADYELRRELLRAKKSQGIERLDALASRLEYLPITTAAMLQAAQFWAQARQQGQPTADNQALDGDVILDEQAVVLNTQKVVIATTNDGHV